MKLLIENGTVVSLDRDRRIFRQGAVAIADTKTAP